MDEREQVGHMLAFLVMIGGVGMAVAVSYDMHQRDKLLKDQITPTEYRVERHPVTAVFDNYGSWTIPIGDYQQKTKDVFGFEVKYVDGEKKVYDDWDQQCKGFVGYGQHNPCGPMYPDLTLDNFLALDDPTTEHVRVFKDLGYEEQGYANVIWYKVKQLEEELSYVEVHLPVDEEMKEGIQPLFSIYTNEIPRDKWGRMRF